MSIADKLSRLSDARDDIITALAGKNVTATGHGFEDFPDDIDAIQTGSGSAVVVEDTTDAHGGTIREITAVSLAGDTVNSSVLVSGYTAHDAMGNAITGQLVPGGGTVTLQTKSETYTPTTSQQTDTITADVGYDGLEEVDITVNAVPTGSVTAPASITGSSATVSTGTNTMTFTKSVSVTPNVTTAGYISSGTAGTSSVSLTASVNTRSSTDLSASGATVTVPAGYYASQATKSVSNGTAGTPTATKGTVSNHSISVTPSVTNTSGYITGSTKTGTAVTVSASELVSGNKEITSNGSDIDVSTYSTVSVNVSGGGGTSKNVQVVQGTTRASSSTATAIGASLTVSKTGTYDVYWSGFRTNTSTSYTWATQLYVGGTAYGSENTTWTNNQQNNHLSNVSLTANQTVRVYGRETRGSSYYVCAPTLIIVEA